MAPKSISIRRAHPDDAGLLAWTMLAASRAHLPRGVWDLLIGADERGRLAYLQRLAVSEPRSLCHYESFVVAEVEGQPAGALSMFDSRGGGWATVGEAMSHVQRDIGWTEAEEAASRERVAAVWACFLPDVGADWQIENIATRPEYRRHGVARALIDCALCEGRERGRRLVQIITFIGNEAAQSVYQGHGFRWSDERRCAGMASVVGAVGFVRFIRTL
jgi:ribosomal protein S18 acetylase RimI-like enzyme